MAGSVGMTPIRNSRYGGPALAGLAAVALGGAMLVAGMRFGPAGLLAPPAAVGCLALVQRAGLALAVFMTLVVFAEAGGTGLLPFLDELYTPIAAGVAAVDLLLALAVAAVALELLRRGEPVRLPALLVLPLALLALAVAAGAVVGYARGASAVDVVYAGRQLPYLIVLPVLVFNVVRTRRDLLAALALGAALAVLKAVLGLLAVGAGRGVTVEGATITYYEPVANWLMLVALLGVLAAVLLRARDRIPLWLVLGSPLMLASLALSFRRSFWIGLALGLVLVLVLGASPKGRRLLVPAAALVVAAIWALGAVGFQTQGPVAERAESLRPSAIAANAEDRYRFDERANVLAELAAHPVAGLGLAIEWSSAARPLGVEHENGRQYVHMIALWYWLKLGLLGLLAYLAVMFAAVVMAWGIWRRDPDPLLRAAGLAALCSLAALAAVETTGSFTGVEARFSMVFGALLGVLAAAYRGASSRSTRSPTA